MYRSKTLLLNKLLIIFALQLYYQDNCCSVPLFCITLISSYNLLMKIFKTHLKPHFSSISVRTYLKLPISVRTYLKLLISVHTYLKLLQCKGTKISN